MFSFIMQSILGRVQPELKMLQVQCFCIRCVLIMAASVDSFSWILTVKCIKIVQSKIENTWEKLLIVCYNHQVMQHLNHYFTLFGLIFSNREFYQKHVTWYLSFSWSHYCLKVYTIQTWYGPVGTVMFIGSERLFNSPKAVNSIKVICIRSHFEEPT